MSLVSYRIKLLRRFCSPLSAASSSSQLHQIRDLMNPQSSSQSLEGDSRRFALAVIALVGLDPCSGVHAPAKGSARLKR